MQKIAIIDKATQKVINISEDENLPVATENDSEVRAEFIAAHDFVFSETAKIGDDFDGENFISPEEETPELTIEQQIRAIESTITPRRLRDAILGTDDGWLAETESAIDALRDQL